ncbi:MAG TPA: hypothetical protein VI454_04690 [Verrucomicrobiae bacterium]
MRTNLFAFFQLLFAFITTVSGASFQNLGFELADLAPVPSGEYGNFVPATNAIPKWEGYLGASPATQVWHNNLALGSANISILGPYWPTAAIIEGQYTVVLQSGVGIGGYVGAAIAQTGFMPSNSLSIQLKVLGANLDVTFAGTVIPLIQLGGGSNYVLYGGDVSAFAGQVGELRLTSVPTSERPFNNVSIDAIAFSPEPIPEPQVYCLFGTAMLLVAWRLRGTVTKRGQSSLLLALEMERCRRP